jgi:chromosomal replication initiation ATPase DnaA
MSFDYRAATGREDFLVTSANEEAVAWIDKWPDWPMRCLLLIGPAGSGKTHLADVWQSRAAAKVIQAEDLASLGIEEISALAEKPLVIENLGQDVEQELLFHLFNFVQEKGGSLLMTAKQPPSHWGLTLKDLSSRLGTVPIARIKEPDDALFAALVVKLFSDRQLAVTPDVVQYIVQRLERSFAEARRFVKLLDNSALAKKRKITMSLLREVFKEEQG